VRTLGLRSNPNTTPIARASRSCAASIEGRPADHADSIDSIATRAGYAALAGRVTLAAVSASSSPRCCAAAQINSVPA
jgi:hypothetical protein